MIEGRVIAGKVHGVEERVKGVLWGRWRRATWKRGEQRRGYIVIIDEKGKGHAKIKIINKYFT